MSDLIDRQQAIDVLEKQLDYLFMLNKKDNPTAESKWYGINWARNMIAELPTAEPKTGKWIRITQGLIVEKYACSVCGRIIEDGESEALLFIKYPYCHCGAKMERGNDEDALGR